MYFVNFSVADLSGRTFKRRIKMKKVLIATLSTGLIFGIAGCATNNEQLETTETTMRSTALEAVQPEITESEIAEIPSDVAIASESQEESGSVPGTWHTVSIVPNDDGTGAPEHYVQFTDTSINYGHMEDEEFVVDYSDTIALLNKTVTGGFTIQAKSSTGEEYTYRTAENDTTVLEYYSTWDEAEYADKYSATASLMRQE